MADTRDPSRNASGASGDPARRVDDYLDGRLAGGELAEFERARAARPDLRAQIDLQGRIDDSLNRRLGTGDRIAEALRRRLGRDGRPIPLRRGRGWWWYAAAAALLLAALPAVWFGARSALQTKLEAAYRQTRSAGFKPQVVCTTDEEFKRWVWTNYQTAIVPAADRGGVEFVGWSYRKVLGPYSALLLARAEGRDVLVVMDHREQAAAYPPDMPRFPGLKVYKREIGKLAFFEVSPLDHPAVIEVLREADPPAP